MRSLLAYSKDGIVEEKLTLRIKADNSGNIYLPVAWFSPEWWQNCVYDWKVSIDGKSAVNYSWVGSSTGWVRVGYGLTPLSIHTVTIKPQVERYGWLRAFGYKGTSYASSLINIISDKSYKGYANSEIYTWDWYKAYQYYGCINLINTDEELLPDTLEIIGDNYRYYEYAGCTSLVSNADEKILKTVKVIWDNYRAYQYQNCTGINRINMRAINWASVGSNYRYNQYSGTANDRKPMNIYIEWWIEEGGSWGLNNDNVKGVYVYKDLVNDYKTKLSGITSSKIQKNSLWDNLEYEFIEYIGIADSSWKMRIPVGGYSTSFTQNCAYDWMVSVDGGEAVEINGTGSATYVSVGSGLVEWSEHRVVIKPKTISWGWWRAFGFHTTWAQAYIKELIHDSYKCFATSRTGTWAHYKHWTFIGCTNLINSYEKLPTSVTSIGASYMSECYGWCTALKTAFWEVLHHWISIGADYRYHQYTGCTALEEHQGIAWYTGTTYPTNYKYEYLSGAGNNMDVYITRYEKLASGLTNSMGIADANVDKIYGFIDDIYDYTHSSYWSNITDSKFRAWYYGYIVYEYGDIDRYIYEGSGTINTRPSSEYWIDGVWGLANNGKLAVGVGWSDASSYRFNNIYKYNLGTRNDIRTIGTNYTSVMKTQASSWAERYRGFYARGDKFYAAYQNGNAWYYVLKQYKVNGTNFTLVNTINLKLTDSSSSYAYAYPWLWFSNNGQFFTYCSEDDNVGSKYFRWVFRMTTPRDISTAVQVSKTENLYKWLNIRFSDDGYKMYTSDGKQYNLSIPFDMATAVDSWKSINGLDWLDFSREGDRLYWGFSWWNPTQYKLT